MSISSSTRGCTSSHGVDSAAICVLACRLVFPVGHGLPVAVVVLVLLTSRSLWGMKSSSAQAIA